MTTITLDWEPEGSPKPDGRQALRTEQYDIPKVGHLVATLRPHNGPFGPYYELAISAGSLDLSIGCHCHASGKMYAAAWIDAIAYWDARVTELQAALPPRPEAAPVP